ncbi:hypothetical protein FKN01_23950 [Streptomyces sp. 130]|nr:hypothetical protein FKN01_23950 [Streptomyces sp. 130]
MGAPRRSPRSGRHSRTAPLPSRSLSAPAGGIVVTVTCDRTCPASKIPPTTVRMIQRSPNRRAPAFGVQSVFWVVAAPCVRACVRCRLSVGEP